MSSVFDRWLLQRVRVTQREVFSHQALTAGTRTTDSYWGSWVIRAPLKPFALPAFRWNLFQPACMRKIKTLQVMLRAEESKSSNIQHMAFYSFMLKAKCIKIQLLALKKSSFWTFPFQSQVPSGGLLEVSPLGSCLDSAHLELKSRET